MTSPTSPSSQTGPTSQTNPTGQRTIRRATRRAAIERVTAAMLFGVAASATTSAAEATERHGPGRPSHPPRPRRPRIGIVLYDGFSLLDATGPAELLARLPGASVSMVAERRGPVRTDTRQTSVVAERSIDEGERFDVLLVPGGNERDTTAAMNNPALIEWVRSVDRHTTWTTSVCTGALVLGAAGLLPGRATTHWASASYLERTFRVRYLAERYVEDGKVITAAGVSAGIDMALLLADRLAGERIARALQLAVEYDPRPPFDSGNAADASPDLRALALRLLSPEPRG